MAQLQSIAFLQSTDTLIIQQVYQPLEAITGYELENKYVVMTQDLRICFYMNEISGELSRNATYGPDTRREFRMKVTDMYGNLIAEFHKPYFCCFASSISVFSPPGIFCGRVKRICPIFKPTFSVYDANSNVIFKIKGPCCAISGFSKVKFDVIKNNGAVAGNIYKEYGDIMNATDDITTFVVTFPNDITYTMKLTMLAAAILFDYLYYENDGILTNILNCK